MHTDSIILVMVLGGGVSELGSASPRACTPDSRCNKPPNRESRVKKFGDTPLSGGNSPLNNKNGLGSTPWQGRPLQGDRLCDQSVYTHIHMYIHTCTHIYIYIYMSLSLSLYIYIYIYVLPSRPEARRVWLHHIITYITHLVYYISNHSILCYRICHST